MDPVRSCSPHGRPIGGTRRGSSRLVHIKGGRTEKMAFLCVVRGTERLLRTRCTKFIVLYNLSARCVVEATHSAGNKEEEFTEEIHNNDQLINTRIHVA